MNSLLEQLTGIHSLPNSKKKDKLIKSMRKKIDTKVNHKPKLLLFEFPECKNNTLINKNKLCDPYVYPELKEPENKLQKLYLEQDEIFKNQKNIQSIKKKLDFLGYTRVVSEVISKKFKLKMNNAYVKLWEIYSEVPEIFNKTNLNIFHVAEAPGNWIKCTENYVNKLNKNKEEYRYQWYANSLNPENKINIEKLGKFFIKDNYGLIRKNKDKWIYGKDDTGDITIVKNLIWFKNFFKENKFRVDIVTGDGGLGDTNIELSFIQKLEIAQLLSSITVLEKGGHCIFKHFCYYNRYYQNSLQGSGFMISFLYLYYSLFNRVICIKPRSSNPRSGEYYLVGLGFKGITESQINKLYNSLNNFQENNTFFNKEDIPIDFQKKAINIIRKLFNYNISHINTSNVLFTCFLQKYKKYNAIIKCEKYFNTKAALLRKKNNYNEWNRVYKFNDYQKLIKKKQIGVMTSKKTSQKTNKKTTNKKTTKTLVKKLTKKKLL